MKFKTEDGFEFEVDLKARVLKYIAPAGEPEIQFVSMSGVFPGSERAKFYDAIDQTLLITPPVLAVEDDPLDAVTGEDGNLVFRTRNTVYEVNLEQKLFRRLAGHNSPLSNELEHEWYPYTAITEIEIGRGVEVYFGQNPHGRDFLGTTRVTKITGTFVPTPHAPTN